MAYVFGVQPIHESFGFGIKAFVKPMQNRLNFEFFYLEMEENFFPYLIFAYA
jgi:hypothetical protein